MFKVTDRECNEIGPLAFVVALLSKIFITHVQRLCINTRLIILAHTLINGLENQGQVKYYPVAPILLSEMYRALRNFKKGHIYFQGYNLLFQWWILIHLAKGHGTQDLNSLDNKKTLRD